MTFVVLSSLLVICGCREGSDLGAGVATSPLPPIVSPPPLPPSPASIPNWKGNATVVSVTRGLTPPCGWGTSPNETRNGVEWRIVATDGAILLDEDMRNWPTDDGPYSGTLVGAQFTASYAGDANYAQFACQFREATLTGTFTSDSTFEALETVIWGRPGMETTVQRRWTGSRL
jgi:hypothetical protein